MMPCAWLVCPKANLMNANCQLHFPIGASGLAQIGLRSRCSWRRTCADQMAGHLRHRHALGQPQDLGIEIEVPLRLAIAAVDLQQLPLPDQVADRHRLEPKRLRLAPALALFRSFSSSTSSGSREISLEIRRASSLVSRLSETAIAPSGWP